MCIPILSFIKIGAVLTIIGFFQIVMKIEERTANHSKELPIKNIMIIWTIVIYLIILITNVSVEILFIMVLIGLLVIYELTSKAISLPQRNRIHFTIIIFLMIILFIFITKIISMSSI